jgi:hypothetical protein
VTYVVIHPYDFNFNEFERVFLDFNRSFGIRCNPSLKRFKLGENRALNMRECDEIVRTRMKGIFVEQSLSWNKWAIEYISDHHYGQPNA